MGRKGQIHSMSSKAPAVLGSTGNKPVAEFSDNGRSKRKNTQGHVTLKIQVTNSKTRKTFAMLIFSSKNMAWLFTYFLQEFSVNLIHYR